MRRIRKVPTLVGRGLCLLWIKAAYGLGQLLSTGGEPHSLAESIGALVESTKDENEQVRREAIEALDTIVCGNVQLPRVAVQRLREIVKFDISPDVVESAKVALEHVMRQKENRLNTSQKCGG